MKLNITRNQIATSIAILFHVIGFIGILFFDRSFFIHATPVNLLLMFLLLLYTQQKANPAFFLFFMLCFITGIAVEIAGTQTGWLFGHYQYGDVLGPAILHVPFMIGINWFIIIYCCGISVHMLLNKIIERLNAEQTSLKALSIIVDGATLAVLFDYLLEPVAVKLGYWKWNGAGTVPFYNYLCWFLVSVLLLLVFHNAGFDKRNKFAVNLLLIQAMFFLLLRTFL